MRLPSGQVVKVCNFNLCPPYVPPMIQDPRALFTKHHVLQPCQWTRLPNGQVISVANKTYHDYAPLVNLGNRGNIYASTTSELHGVNLKLKARI